LLEFCWFTDDVLVLITINFPSHGLQKKKINPAKKKGLRSEKRCKLEKKQTPQPTRRYLTQQEKSDPEIMKEKLQKNQKRERRLENEMVEVKADFGSISENSCLSRYKSKVCRCFERNRRLQDNETCD